MRYYKCMLANEKRWHLAIERKFPNGDPVDIWAYTRSQPVDANTPVPFEIYAPGEQVDFDPTAFGTIVASKKMADIVSTFAGDGIQRLTATVRGGAGEWEVLNVLDLVDCIDYERSKIQYYPSDHPEKPNKPRGIMKLIVDPDKARGHHFFHPQDWHVATLVSEELKTALERENITGIEYWPVTERVNNQEAKASSALET